MIGRTIKLVCNISGKMESVSGTIVSNEDTWLSVAVNSLEDAFKLCYCYCQCKLTKIEKLPTKEFGEYLVVVVYN